MNREMAATIPTLVLNGNGNSKLEQLLKRDYPQLEVSGISEAQLECFEKPQSQTILFFDFDVADKAASLIFPEAKNNMLSIIATAKNEDFAMKAFKLSAIDYLLKPICENELRIALSKVIHSQNKLNTQSQQLPSLKRDKLALPVFDGISFISISEILYCESSNNYTYFYMRTGERILVSRTLKEFEEQLSQHTFFRIHQKYLINLSFVNRYIRGRGGYVMMENDKELPVSARKREQFLQLAGCF